MDSSSFNDLMTIINTPIFYKIFFGLVAFSLGFIIVMWFIYNRFLPKELGVPQLWLENKIGSDGYVLFSICTPAFAVIMDLCYTSQLKMIGTVDILQYLFSYVSLVVAFWVYRSVFRKYIEAYVHMLPKVQFCKDVVSVFFGLIKLKKETFERNIRAFGVVAGGRTFLAIYYIATTAAVYSYFRFIVFPEEVSVFFGPMSFLVSIFAGLFAAMTFTCTFFIGFCSVIFRDPEHYDLESPDGHGGFKNLGDLATWSYLLFFLLPIGVAMGVLTDIVFFPSETTLIAIGSGIVTFVFFAFLPRD